MTGPARSDALRELGELRAIQREREASLHGGKPPTCRRGCASCCRQMVFDVTAVEVEDLGLHLRREDREDEVVARLRRRRDLFDRTKLQNPRFPGEDEDAWIERVARLFWALGEPCAFLDEDESCTVHDHRPQSCRRFFVYGPSGLCTATGCDDPRRRAEFVELDDMDDLLEELSGAVAFDPEDDRLDHAMVRWLENRSRG